MAIAELGQQGCAFNLLYDPRLKAHVNESPVAVSGGSSLFPPAQCLSPFHFLDITNITVSVNQKSSQGSPLAIKWLVSVF